MAVNTDGASLACPLLTSRCVAQFLTGLGLVPVCGPGVGDPDLTHCLTHTYTHDILVDHMNSKLYQGPLTLAQKSTQGPSLVPVSSSYPNIPLSFSLPKVWTSIFDTTLHRALRFDSLSRTGSTLQQRSSIFTPRTQSVPGTPGPVSNEGARDNSYSALS